MIQIPFFSRNKCTRAYFQCLEKKSVRMKREEFHEAVRERVNGTVEGSSVIVLCNTRSRGRGK